jgi:hypothetical protein
MKKIFFPVAICGVSVMFILMSCNKSNDKPQTQDVKALLLNKNWKLTAFTVDPAIDWGSGETHDVLSAWEVCDKDDLYIFHDNSVFVYDQGALNCGYYDQQETSTWSYSESSKLLTYCIGTPGSCDSYSWTLTEINDSQFKVTNSEAIGGTVYAEQVTFTKQ